MNIALDVGSSGGGGGAATSAGARSKGGKDKNQQHVMKKRKAASLSTIALDMIVCILEYLDILSLATASTSNKALRSSGRVTAERVWRYLAAIHFSSRFVSLPAGMPFIKALMIYFTSKREEVLIMGGSLIIIDEGSVYAEAEDEVTKMVIEQDGSIRFEECTPMLQPRGNFQAVYHHGEVFALGLGQGLGTPVGTVERLDKLSQKQTMMEMRLPNDLYHAAFAIFNDELVVVGGAFRDEKNDHTSSYSIYTLVEHASQASRGVWQVHAAKLKTSRTYAAVCAFEGKLHFGGGFISGASFPSSIEVFDPAIGAWEKEEEEMTVSRCGFSLIVYNEELYAIGGARGDHAEESFTIEKKNKDTHEWEEVTDLGTCRYGAATALVGAKLYLFGGGDVASNCATKTTWDFFDMSTNTWASQDEDGDFFEEATRQLPRKIEDACAVHITPEASMPKTWTNLA